MELRVKPFFAILAICLATAWFCAQARASDTFSEYLNARAMGMGGAVTSIPDPMMGVRANPAAIARERGYFGGGTYLNRDKDQLDAVLLTVVDNASSKLAGAFQYERLGAHQEAETVGLTLAYANGSQAYGATARYYHTRPSSDGDWDGGFVGDVGFLLQRDWGFRLGIAAKDLLAEDFAVVETRISVGASVDLPWGILAAADMTRAFDQDFDRGHSIHLGMEWRPLQSVWAVRLGQMWDAATADDYQSFGFGWDNQVFEVGYAARFNRQISGEVVHILSLSASF